MAEISVDISQEALEELARDWSGPIGEAVARATQVAEDEARILAPVSASGGSRLAPPGTLKAGTRALENIHHDERGFVMGLVKAPSYPYNFVANPRSRKGRTVNRGHKTSRPGDDRFLEFALNSVPFQVYRV